MGGERKCLEGYFIIKPTIKVPCSWKERIEEYMRTYGFSSYGELFRHLIRKEIIERGGRV